MLNQLLTDFVIASPAFMVVAMLFCLVHFRDLRKEAHKKTKPSAGKGESALLKR